MRAGIGRAVQMEATVSILYVVTPGASIRKQGDTFRVTSPDGMLLEEIEGNRLESALVLSSVDVTTQAMASMLRQGVELAIMAQDGTLLGQLTPPMGRNILLRREQYRKQSDAAFALARAKEVVDAKVHNQREVLVRQISDHGVTPEVEMAAAQIEAMLPRIAQAPDADVLRGLEGACARHYWAAFGTMLKADGIAFSGRRFHPSPDPANAVLSLGYMLLCSSLNSMLDAMGFDPFLGFFHTEAYGRPSLALDLVEPYRAPVVDRLAVRLFNLRVLKTDDFEPSDDGGVRLKVDALRVFFKAWEQRLGQMGVRLSIRSQAEGFRRVILGEQDILQPYRWSSR